MWEIIGALFGGGYLAAKVASDKSAAKGAARKREEWHCALDEWRTNITDESLENKLELYVHNNPADAAQKAKALCQFIPENQHSPTTYLRVLLSEYGKIKMDDAAFGITTPLYVPNPVLEAKQKYRDFFEFVIWLNRNLERHGANTGEILFVPSYPKTNSKSYYSSQEAGRLLEYGTYVWAPQRINIYLDKK